MAQQDTIWDYAYPVLNRPLVLLDSDGNITAFRCSGLTYDKSVVVRMNGWSNSESLHIFSNEKMWKSSFDDLRIRLGITDNEILQKLVIQTIAYHHFIKKDKERTRDIIRGYQYQPFNEAEYIRNFEKKWKNGKFDLNRKGRIYNRVAWEQRRHARQNSR